VDYRFRAIPVVKNVFSLKNQKELKMADVKITEAATAPS
jgi:hypothetical protein